MTRATKQERNGGFEMNETQLVAAIKAHIAKGDKAQDKAEQHYIAAGQHLKTLKAQHEGSWAEWEALLKERVGIGKSRASELMLIADGTKTVAQVRAEKAESMRQVRAQPSPQRGGEIGPPEISVSEPGPDGEIKVTIVTRHHVSEVHEPGCPNAVPCPECGSETVSDTVAYKCTTPEDALGIVRAYTDPESYGLLRRIVCLYHSSVTRSREFAQWLAGSSPIHSGNGRRMGRLRRSPY
jgi:hypothetical protein